jgi:hypothetical protein
MSIEPIRTEVRGLLALTNEEIRQAERIRANDDGAARVHAAGALVYLRRRQEMLKDRMHELDEWHDGVGGAFVQWVRESWMIVMFQLRLWIER